MIAWRGGRVAFIQNESNANDGFEGSEPLHSVESNMPVMETIVVRDHFILMDWVFKIHIHGPEVPTELLT